MYIYIYIIYIYIYIYVTAIICVPLTYICGYCYVQNNGAVES